MSRKEIYHVGAYGVLVKNEKLLLVHKARGPYTGRFDLPGGKIKHGEIPEHTLAREIREETGVIPIKWHPRENFSITINYEENGELVSFYHLGLLYVVTEFDDSNFQADLCEEDVTGAHWDNLNAIDVMTPFARHVTRELRQKIFTDVLLRRNTDA